MIKLLLSSIIMLVFLTSYSFSQDKNQFDGKIVKDIKLKGLINTSKDLIIARLNFNKGDKFNSNTIKETFKDFHGLGLFKKISVDVEPDGNKVVVIFTFDELPKVEAVVIEGSDDISEKDIIGVMILKPGNIYENSSIIEDEKNITELYKKHGFDGSIIQVRARKGANVKLVNVIVTIQEGKEVFIESIKIIGTKTLDPDDIYDQILSRESTVFRGGEVFDPDKLVADRERIVQYLKNNSFWDGKVKSVKIRKELVYPNEQGNTEKGYFIVIEIEEGHKYTMGEINFSGNTIFNSKQLNEHIKIKKGNPYNDSKLKQGLRKITEEYNNIGYIQALITPNPIVDKKKYILNWEIEIIEGEKVHIESIRISGNDKTKIWVVDQELEIFEGEMYNFKKIKKSVNNLKNTQFFGNININPEPGSDDGLVSLNFKVEEQRTGIISAGVGYGTVAGFSVFEEVTEKNLFGTGWRISERIEVGEKQFSINIGTSTRWLIPYIPILFSANVKYIQNKVNAYYSIDPNKVKNKEYTYKRRAFEVDLNIGYAFHDYWTVSNGWLVSITKAESPTNFTINDLDSNTVRGRSLYEDLTAGRYLIKVTHRIGLIFDTRDLHINTRNGVKINAFISYTGGFYQGDSHWIKIENSYAFYINPVWELVLAFFASYEIMFKQFDGKFSVRDYDRLRFDGLNELRGWRQSTKEEVVGQGGKLSFSFEIRFPIFKEILWGVLFADAGDVTDEIASFPASINHFSFGFGFRIHIPLIPIRLYFAKLGEIKNKKFSFRDGIEAVFTVGGYF